jgi:PAS domain S-box-containing protein
VVSIEYADSSNETFGIVRDNFEVDVAYGESGQQTGYTYKLFEIDDGTIKHDNLLWSLEKYDARERSWYRKAVEANSPTWTEIYPWPNGNVGLDAITVVQMPDGKQAVLDASLTLGKIRTFLNNLKSDKVAQLYILEKDGAIVSGTDIESPVNVISEENFERTYAAQSSSRYLQAAYSAMVADGGIVDSVGRTHLITVEGEKPYVVQVTKYADDYGLELYMLVLVPREVVLGRATSALIVTFLLTAAAISISVVVSYLISRAITMPISKFANAIKEFAATGKVTELPVATSREVVGLIDSFKTMSKKITAQVQQLKVKETYLAWENEKLHSTLESVGEGVVVVDEKQTIMLANKLAATLTGYPITSLKGSRLGEVVQLKGGEEAVDIDDFVSLALTKRKRLETWAQTSVVSKNGREIPIFCIASPIILDNGALFGCVLVMRDITEEQRIDNAKKEILSVASHQLRTPLSTVKWYAELALSKQARLPATQKKALKEIIHTNERMIDLVDTLLSASQFELGVFDISPERIDVHDLVDDTIQFYRKNIADKKLRVDVEFSKEARYYDCDKKLSGVIVQNLISNAIKYSMRGGRIQVTGTRGSKYYELTVSDEGIGIAEQDKAKIFSRLYRGDAARKHAPEGTGIGLYLVKSVVERCGGTVNFVSTEGEGATFTVRFPAKGMKRASNIK